MLDTLDADWLWALCIGLCGVMIWLYKLVEARSSKQEALKESLANS